MRNRTKIHGILRLGEKYGDQRLNRACARAMAFDNTQFKSIKRILDQGLDLQDLPQAVNTPILSKEGQSFIRPGSYYAVALHMAESRSGP